MEISKELHHPLRKIAAHVFQDLYIGKSLSLTFHDILEHMHI